MSLSTRLMHRLLRRKLGVALLPVQSITEGHCDGAEEPGDAQLESLKDFLCANVTFLARSRSLGCQIAISDRLVALLKARYGADLDAALANVPVIHSRACGSGPVVYLARSPVPDDEVPVEPSARYVAMEEK